MLLNAYCDKFKWSNRMDVVVDWFTMRVSGESSGSQFILLQIFMGVGNFMIWAGRVCQIYKCIFN